MQKFTKYYKYLFFLIGLTSCAFPLATYHGKFPVPLYLEGEGIEQSYSLLEDVFHNDERSKKDLDSNKPNKGYSSDEKEMLLYELSKKAKSLGADAIIEVKMQLYMTKDVYGYNVQGKAVRFLRYNKP